ncbi:histidine phosphatase family protein [Pseudoduganella aquatica]|uniref:Histidine phosphatase family protein n=1 Tax=Pseudoduganella aquatica TaxID=2660641 RepID=A0A7X4HAM4_9BURK|nr:histidine phosphatase family protein [Pseudoduganella aquatica]MYN07328.1 histidine phosphatase family protein [Pseudoduganella aquatica]
MTTSILLIRHGETAWNAVRRLQGHIDIPLNPEGRRQADALARALAAEPLHAIIASDLQRALQTAQAVAGPDRTVQQDVQLRERCYGVFEGMLYADIERTYPAEFAAWQARDIDAVPPAGERVAESFRQFFHRCTDGIAAWAVRHPGQTIAIVAHGGVLECAYRAATGMTLESPRDFQVKNASINRFTFANGKLALQSWGETAHLEQLVLDDIV